MISIIIATYNSEKLLFKCLQSISRQLFKDIEVIIVDGASKDNTLKIAESFKLSIPNLEIICEPDDGIYDAWNKAVILARGDYILFLGSDDELHSDNSLLVLSNLMKGGSDFIVCGLSVVDDMRTVLYNLHPSKLPDYFIGMPIPHPSTLHKASLFKKHGLFDKSYKISGDFEHFLRCYRQSSIEFHDESIVKMHSGGISHNKRMKVRIFRENLKAKVLYGYKISLSREIIEFIKSVFYYIVSYVLPIKHKLQNREFK